MKILKNGLFNAALHCSAKRIIVYFAHIPCKLLWKPDVAYTTRCLVTHLC